MQDFITVSHRKSIFLWFILKIKYFFFLKKSKKQFKKDLKNDVYFTKLRDNNPISDFNYKDYINMEFNK